MNLHLSPRSGQPPLPHNHARYDAEYRINQVDGTSGNCSTATVCYVYDGDGLRVKKSSGTLYWRNATGGVLAESDLTGNITNEYVFFAGRRIARISGSTVNYFYSDALGTIHTITDATGHACYDASFTPYGQEVLNPNITQTCSSNYKFTGYEYDSETGLFYAMARYYNPRLGRFMSPDPLGAKITDPQSLNRYAYVLNDPENAVDPRGELSCNDSRDLAWCEWLQMMSSNFANLTSGSELGYLNVFMQAEYRADSAFVIRAGQFYIQFGGEVWSGQIGSDANGKPVFGMFVFSVLAPIADVYSIMPFLFPNQTPNAPIMRAYVPAMQRQNQFQSQLQPMSTWGKAYEFLVCTFTNMDSSLIGPIETSPTDSGDSPQDNPINSPNGKGAIPNNPSPGASGTISGTGFVLNAGPCSESVAAYPTKH